MKAYLIAAERLIGIEQAKLYGGLIANVGETDRPLEERIRDSDYARKAAGGVWQPLRELHINNFSDHDIHSLLDKHPEVEYTFNPNNPEEYRFKTDPGDGSVAIKIFEEVVGKLVGKIHQVLPSFTPRFYQEYDIGLLVQILRLHFAALLSPFPGWGKSASVGEIIRRITEELDYKVGGPFLITTPAVDTLRDIKENLTTKAYGGVRFFVITSDEIDNTTIEKIKTKMVEGFTVVLLISVQGLRRGDEGTRRAKESIESDLCEKYEFLNHLPVVAWIRDEGHKEYNGIVTCEVFKNIKAQYVLDMTATPYNLIEGGMYIKEQIVGITILNVLHKKRNKIEGFEDFQDFPFIEIETWEGAPLRDTELGKIYSSEEEWNPRKLFVIEKNQLVHASAILELNRLMYDRFFCGGKYRSGISKDKNKLSIMNDPRLSMIAKQIGMHILPEGNYDNSAEVHCELYVKLCNTDPNGTMAYVSSYSLEREVRSQGCKMSVLIKEKLKRALGERKRGLIIVTHRKLLIGSDIPALGHIVLLDKIGVLNEFIQTLGRLFRPYEYKECVRMYIACPGMSVSIRLYEAAKAETKQYGDREPREYFDCIPITEYDDRLISHLVDWESAVDRFNQHQARILNGDWYSKAYLTHYPELAILVEGMIFDLLKSEGKIQERITLTTNAKVKKPLEKREGEGEKEKNIANDWRETIVTMLNEAIRLGYSNGSETLKEVFTTEAAEFEFGKNNVELIRIIFEYEEFYQAVNKKYIECLREVRSLGYE